MNIFIAHMIGLIFAAAGVAGCVYGLTNGPSDDIGFYLVCLAVNGFCLGWNLAGVTERKWK